MTRIPAAWQRATALGHLGARRVHRGRARPRKVELALDVLPRVSGTDPGTRAALGQREHPQAGAREGVATAAPVRRAAGEELSGPRSWIACSARARPPARPWRGARALRRGPRVDMMPQRRIEAEHARRASRAGPDPRAVAAASGGSTSATSVGSPLPPRSAWPRRRDDARAAAGERVGRRRREADPAVARSSAASASVLGERAGLVGADHRGAPSVSTALKSLDHGAAAGEQAHATASASVIVGSSPSGTFATRRPMAKGARRPTAGARQRARGGGSTRPSRSRPRR